ncbi:hypothetical protein C0J45_1751 [Silurus meridionalis]|nr:hypothetical protein C0J45_1751 [Silurus meridionalis]
MSKRNVFASGLDYSDHYEDLTDDDDDDDDDYSRQNNGYCGFAENFLDKRVSKQLSAIPHYKTVKRVTPERQRERRRLEKLEKENGNKDGAKQNAAAVPDKSQPTESENKEKTNNGVPPDPGPKCSSIASESSDSCNEDDGDDNESIIDELELDMSSCFVNNAAAIAKRKLEQKTKSDRKDKKAENVKIPGTTEPLIKNVDEKASEEPVKDNVTKSMELAVIGNKYAQIGDLDTAVKFFTDAIKHNPQEVKLFGNRSFCYEKMQLYEKALIDADIALSLDPTWIKGLYRKGKALVGLKRYYEAGLTYKKVLKIDSSCTDAAQELMRVQIMQLMVCACVCACASTSRELFPIWVGDLVPALSETKLYELFSNFGTVHSVRLLSMKRCAFINYTNKEDCETAIKKMNGFCIAGTCLVVRYPDRIHTHLGVSKAATTDAGKVNKFPDECFFWRTTGCIKNNRCSYRHVPEHKGIDRPKVK